MLALVAMIEVIIETETEVVVAGGEGMVEEVEMVDEAIHGGMTMVEAVGMVAEGVVAMAVAMVGDLGDMAVEEAMLGVIR